MNFYAIVSEYIGASEPATLEQIEDMVGAWSSDEIEGWTLEVRERNNEVRLYAEATDDTDSAPHAFSHGWVRVTPDIYYHVLAHRMDDEVSE